MTIQTFAEAVETFLLASDSWLTDEDAPAVAALRASALQLDVELTGALLAQHGLIYRSLLRRKPATPPTVDPLEALLSAPAPSLDQTTLMSD
jgi:hypothetical protein